MMKLLPWLLIIALCLAAVAVETADQESLNDMLVARYQRNQLSRGRRDASGDGDNDFQLGNMMQNLRKEIMQLMPIVRRYISSMEKCGLLPASVMQMVRMAGMFLKLAQSAGYLDN